MKKRILVVFLCLNITPVFAQKHPQLGVGLDLGYSHKYFNKGVDQFHIGAEFCYSTDRLSMTQDTKPNIVVLDIGAINGKYNGKSKSMFALGFGYSPHYTNPFLWKVTATPYYVAPSVSFSFLNVVKLNVGYNFGYRNVNGFDMSGMTLGVNVLIGTRDCYYYDWYN